MTGSRRVCLCLAIGALSAGSALAGTIIEGRVVGHEGDPVSPSHVQLIRPSNVEVAVVEVADDGRYTLEVDDEGIVFVRFAALGHEPAEVPVPLEGRRIELDARLSTYRYNESITNVAVRGDMNGWRFVLAPELELDVDNRYSGVFKSRTDSVRYQVMGVVRGRSVAGTDGIGHEYDGKGDYRSIVRTQDGQAAITFDPDLLVASDRERSFSIDDDHEVWLEVMTVAEDIGRRRNEYRSILNQSSRNKTDPGPPLAALRADLPDVLAALERKNDPDLQAARLVAAVHLDRMSQTAGRADTALAIRALELSPDSPHWSLAPEVIGYVIKHTGGFPTHQAWLDTMIEAHPDPDVRKNALVRAVTYSQQLGQEALRDRYLALLKEKFPDSRELAHVTRSMIQAKMMPGKILPDFSVVSLDDPETPITLTSLRGKIVLLDFWATWCRPCLAEMGLLHEVYEEFAGDDFEIVSLSFDRNIAAISRFRDDKWPMPWLHTFVEGGFKSPIAEQLGVASIPKPILIGPEGTILAIGRDLRGDQLRPTVAAALARDK